MSARFVMTSSISSFPLVLLVHDRLFQAYFGIFKTRIEFQSLLEVLLCIVEKTCKGNKDSIKIKHRATFINHYFEMAVQRKCLPHSESVLCEGKGVKPQ